jgi:hypothetical protein
MRRLWIGLILVALQLNSKPADAGKLCPLWEVDYLPDEMVMYYCDRFTTEDCTDTPTVDYYVGNHSWPTTNCPDCVAYYDENRDGDLGENSKADKKAEAIRGGVTPYPGFEGGPKDHDYPGPALYEEASEASDILVNPKVQYVKAAMEEKYAKVFVYVLDVEAKTGNPQARPRKIYVAFEVKDKPTFIHTEKEAVWTPIPPTGSAPHAFRAIVEVEGKRIPIMVLKAR